MKQKQKADVFNYFSLAEEPWINLGGGNLNSMTSFSSILGEWLNHIQNILVGASWIAAQISEEAASVLVHCRFLS